MPDWYMEKETAPYLVHCRDLLAVVQESESERILCHPALPRKRYTENLPEVDNKAKTFHIDNKSQTDTVLNMKTSSDSMVLNEMKVPSRFDGGDDFQALHDVRHHLVLQTTVLTFCVFSARHKDLQM
jgi:hypothetical protein